MANKSTDLVDKIHPTQLLYKHTQINIISFMNTQLNRLRRIALNAQGLYKPQNFGKGIQGARKAIQHLGYIQLDTISVIERAHHHVFYSRVPGFKSEMANRMLREGDIFEYWSHAAAFLPMSDFRFSLPYKHAIKNGQVHWYKNPDKKLMRELLARVRSDGPLRSRDLEHKKKSGAGWWDWKPAKKALEQLYMEGELMVCDRESFQKTYDLTERVLPSAANTNMPSAEEYAEHVLKRQLQCHAFVSLKGLNYHQTKNPALRTALKTLVNEKLGSGELLSVKLDSGEEFFSTQEVLDAALPRKQNRVLILSPFDNSVIQRERLRSLFQFDYQIECYVPEAKRKFGYFSLPILFGEDFVGRMDCKAHRKEGALEIKSLHMEPNSAAQKQEALFIEKFSDALQDFLRFQGCAEIKFGKACPAKLSKALKTKVG